MLEDAGRLGRASTLANLPSQLRQRRSNPKISQMDYWLVVSTILKILVNGKDDIPYMKWKIKAMLETTNQIRSTEGALVQNA